MSVSIIYKQLDKLEIMIERAFPIIGTPFSIVNGLKVDSKIDEIIKLLNPQHQKTLNELITLKQMLIKGIRIIPNFPWVIINTFSFFNILDRIVTIIPSEIQKNVS